MWHPARFRVLVALVVGGARRRGKDADHDTLRAPINPVPHTPKAPTETVEAFLRARGGGVSP